MSGPNVYADRFVVVHNTLDTLSYWQPASEIGNALDQSRIWAGASLLRRIVFTRQASHAFKQGHNYWKLTFEEAIDELVTLRSDPALSEDGRLQIRLSMSDSRRGAHVVMLSLAPSSSLPVEMDFQFDGDMPADNFDEDPIPEIGLYPRTSILKILFLHGPCQTMWWRVRDHFAHPAEKQAVPLPTVAKDDQPTLALPTTTMSSSSRSSSSASFHTVNEEFFTHHQLEELEATFLLPGSTPRSIPEGSLDLEPPPSIASGSHHPTIEWETPEQEMYSPVDSDYEDDSSSSDEEWLTGLADSRYLHLQQGVHDWHVDFPNDPRKT
eukprot:2302970-Amphidinium_carterae.2